PEPLLHPPRERPDPLAANLPEAEALEQHPDPLAALRHAVEPAEEVEVLERGQLAGAPRLVPEVADEPARRQVELARAGGGEPREHAQERRLAGAVRPGHEQEVAAPERDVDPLEDEPRAEALREVAGGEHGVGCARAKFGGPRAAPLLER